MTIMESNEFVARGVLEKVKCDRLSHDRIGLISIFETERFLILTGKSFSIRLFQELPIRQADGAAYPIQLVQVDQRKNYMVESHPSTKDGCCQLWSEDGHRQDAFAIRFHGD